jgi:predicted transcriptional regulator
MKNDLTTEFLQWLGLDSEEVAIYSLLHDKGELTILQLSRLLNLPRTNVYRKVEKLLEIGIVDEVVEEYSTRIKVAEWEKVEYLYEKKKKEYEQFQSLLPKIKNDFLMLDEKNSRFTKVLYYRGEEGIARMSWQALASKDEFRGYSYRQYSELVGMKEAEVFRERWEASGKKGRDIYSDDYVKSVKEKHDLDSGKWKNWQSRYISSKILNVNHQLDIYDDVVAIYSWYEGELFGIQIINEKVANFQKQLFDIMWQMAVEQ